MLHETLRPFHSILAFSSPRSPLTPSEFATRFPLDLLIHLFSVLSPAYRSLNCSFIAYLLSLQNAAVIRVRALNATPYKARLRFFR